MRVSELNWLPLRKCPGSRCAVAICCAQRCRLNIASLMRDVWLSLISCAQNSAGWYTGMQVSLIVTNIALAGSSRAARRRSRCARTSDGCENAVATLRAGCVSFPECRADDAR